jgi:hypothetical protein
MEANTSEPLYRCRKHPQRHQNRGPFSALGQIWGIPAYCPGGGRHRGGANAAQASVRNVGTCRPMLRDNSKRKTRKDESTEADGRGGATRSSDEFPVMGVEVAAEQGRIV